MSASVGEATKPSAEDNKHEKWYNHFNVDPVGLPSSVDLSYFGDDSPHQPPIFDVDVKMAADVEIVEDQDIVRNVAEWWFGKHESRYTKVVKVIFNDISVWYYPLGEDGKDYENIITHVVDRYLPDIVQWKAVVDGDDPREALEEFRRETTEEEPDWVEDLEDTGMSDEYREWFNENLDTIDHIDREVKSRSETEDIDIEVEGDWTDDW